MPIRTALFVGLLIGAAVYPAFAQDTAAIIAGKNCRGTTLFNNRYDGGVNYAFTKTADGLQVHITTVRGRLPSGKGPLSEDQGMAPVKVDGAKVVFTTKSGNATALEFNSSTGRLDGTNTLPMKIWTLCE